MGSSYDVSRQPVRVLSTVSEEVSGEYDGSGGGSGGGRTTSAANLTETTINNNEPVDTTYSLSVNRTHIKPVKPVMPLEPLEVFTKLTPVDQEKSPR